MISKFTSDEDYQPDESDQVEESVYISVTRGVTRRRNPKYVLSITTTQKQVPKSMKLALQDPEWRMAMQEEYDAVIQR